jgi:hypothetical protein
LKKTINKILSLWVWVRHGNVEPRYKYFYRDTYYCQLTQLKYFFKDYLLRKPYKVIKYDGEFANELQFALPFAYWHYMNGTLKATQSSKYTSELYFFSPNHEEIFDTRVTEGNYNFELPRVLYSHNYDMRKWLPVPLKKKYKNDIFVYEKPIVVVANRYNMEWDGAPISYFDIPTLQFIFEAFRSNYKIIYNRPSVKNIILDNSDVYELNEVDWIIKNHPYVISMEDLYNENKARVKSFNHLQLLVYANTDIFISIHGGTATLASYFGGTNIIFSREGPEHYFKCFEKLYPKFSGAKILHAKTIEELEEIVTQTLSSRNPKLEENS